MKLRSEIVMMDAAALSSAINSRQISCGEVMTAYLDHIDAIDPVVNAIVSLRPRAELIEDARRRDAELSRGECAGPMHGFPHAIKDLEATAGIRTTMGSPILKDFIPRSDSILVERIKRAGAIIIGKTNVPEFGLGSHSYNPVFGTTLNAYDQSKTAGGSSGGAAVALALRMLPAADGSDHAGSLRNPAAFNNVFGFRTAFGRVPSDAREVFMPALSVHGPMARTVPDLAMLLSVIAGYDARVPLSIREDSARFADSLARDFKGARIAWGGDFGGIPAVRAGRARPVPRRAWRLRDDGMRGRGSGSRLSNRTRVAKLARAAGVAGRRFAQDLLFRPGAARADETRSAVGNRARLQDQRLRCRRRIRGPERVVSRDARAIREV